MGSTAGFVQSLAQSFPPMMQVLRDVAGVELPGFLGQMAPDAATNGAGAAGVVAVPPTSVTPASPSAEVDAAEPRANGAAR